MTALERLLLLALAALLPACAAAVPRAGLENHLILLDEEGQIVDFDGEPVKRPREHVEAVVRAMQEWVSAERAAAPDGEPPRVLVHVHGGLVTRDATIRRANLQVDEILGQPGDPDRAWPIFISWPSGGFGSWWEATTSLRNGRHEPFIGPVTAPFYVAVDAAQGIARAPNDLVYLLKNDLDAGMKLAFDYDLSVEWSNPEEIVAAMESDPQRRARIAIGRFSRGGGAQFMRACAYTLSFLPTLVVTPIFLDGFGRSAWTAMRHRAWNSGRPSEEFDRVPDFPGAEEARERLELAPTGGLARLVHALAAPRKAAEEARQSAAAAGAPQAGAEAGRDRYELTLVGHSMGAILINLALELHPELRPKDVVYMAPACTIADAARSVVPYLERDQEARFWLLTLHPLAEASEAYWEYLDLPSRGSLLEWIDDWYASASHPLERTFGKWNNAVPALHLFEPVATQVNLKAFGVEGDSVPQRHGDFNDCPYWTRAFRDPEGPLTYPPRE